jgi:hypothetical protein
VRAVNTLGGVQIIPMSELRKDWCDRCESSPPTEYFCEHCRQAESVEKFRRIIDRWSYTRGLTNAEKALLEELVGELEAGR